MQFLFLMINKIENFGGCSCGKVRYKTLGYPSVSAVCHCRYCQLRSGSAFGVLVYFLEDNLKVLIYGSIRNLLIFLRCYRI